MPSVLLAFDFIHSDQYAVIAVTCLYGQLDQQRTISALNDTVAQLWERLYESWKEVSLRHICELAMLP